MRSEGLWFAAQMCLEWIELLRKGHRVHPGAVIAQSWWLDAEVFFSGCKIPSWWHLRDLWHLCDLGNWLLLAVLIVKYCESDNLALENTTPPTTPFLPTFRWAPWILSAACPTLGLSLATMSFALLSAELGWYESCVFLFLVRVWFGELVQVAWVLPFWLWGRPRPFVPVWWTVQQLNRFLGPMTNG